MRITKVSRNFETELIKLSAGAISPENFEKLILLLESEIQRIYFTKTSEANLLRIFHGMLDKIFFINECIRYPHYIEILVTIASNSDFLTDILAVNPEYFYRIVNPSSLKNPLNQKEFRLEIEKSLALYNSFSAKVHLLKTIKRRELLRIGLRDIYSSIPLQEVTNELSVLASSLSSELFRLCFIETLRKYKIQNTSAHYCLISLGKLGGVELNYSSDIDLLLFYDKERKLGNKLLSEILAESTKLFLNSSGDIYGGILYRIDFRLRPDGRNSPICRSIHEYLNYYESRGEDWERQMLIKTDYLAGNKSLYKKFTTYLSPFVYPVSLSTSPKERILKMKADIERKNKEGENIKLLPGGIRDIEFAVQALQLLNGGRIKEIRTGNTLDAVELLFKNKLLDEQEKLTLTDAYILYRKVEHYLQLMNDRQTHIIPDEGELLEKLSFYLSFDSVKKFNQKINVTRDRVRAIYYSILADNELTGRAKNRFEEINFKDVKKADSDFQFLKNGRSITGARTFDSKSIESFTKIENDIIENLVASSNPDETLSNLVRVIRQSAFPSIWYNELYDKTFLSYLMNICQYSQYSIDLFSENKRLRDFMLSRKVFMKIPKKELSKMEVKFILIYLSVQTILELIDPIKTSRLLSDLMKIKIRRITENFTNKLEWENDYFVAALGSLGSLSLTFYSDFDLVFIVRHTKDYSNLEKRFQELLAKLKNELYPFTIDCRLRPEGKSSQLVWDLRNEKEYFQKRARIWEFQSLTKINFITGNIRLFSGFIKSVEKSLTRFRKEEIKRDTAAMRNHKALKRTTGAVVLFDFKMSPGGINDIETIIQYLLLCNSRIFKQSVGNTVIENLHSIEEKLKKKEFNMLFEAYKFYKRVEIYNQLLFNASVTKIDLEGEKLKILIEKLNILNVQEFKSLLKKYTTGVNNIYSRILS